MEAGTEAALRQMSPLRVSQAIASLDPGLKSKGQVQVSVDTTLGANQDGRNIVVLAACTLTFPSEIRTYAIQNASSGNITLSYPTGSDFRTTLYPNEAVILCGDGTGYWRSYSDNGRSLGQGGQVWTSPSRALNTNYQNTTGRAIAVALDLSTSSVTLGETYLQTSPNGSTGWVSTGRCVTGNYENGNTIYGIVPAGYYYRALQSGYVPTIIFWSEMRV
jgi:hypothetical protein